MNFTEEQQAIIASKGNIKINAVAGSGKTTTIIEYAKSRPKHAKILYLAFNKSVKIDAQKKFLSQGVTNVIAETAHSLAYKNIIPKYKYQLKNNGYSQHELTKVLAMDYSKGGNDIYIFANHVLQCTSLFCNSDAAKVENLDYLGTIKDATVKKFVTQYKKHIIQQTRIFLGKMNSGEIPITHDFYLKKFQLESPILPYDYLLFDEGQDASAAMLDVFKKQNGFKVIVGDTHQQIYSWRYATNSLESTNYKTYRLSKSFRFDSSIAAYATKILGWKRHLKVKKHDVIIGDPKKASSLYEHKAFVARTNLGLLIRAIDFVSKSNNQTKLYFEGNFNSYTYADDGASLYDVLNLFNKKPKKIRDPLLKNFQNLKQLEEHVSQTGDKQLGMMIELVQEYKNRIPIIIKKIKDRHVPFEKKSSAQLIFSTVHRCKGMEYDCVELADDFMTEGRLLKTLYDSDSKNADLGKLNEEINLLYVAATRAKKKLIIPENLLPEGIKAGRFLKVIPKKKKKTNSNVKF